MPVGVGLSNLLHRLQHYLDTLTAQRLSSSGGRASTGLSAQICPSTALTHADTCDAPSESHSILENLALLLPECVLDFTLSLLTVGKAMEKLAVTFDLDLGPVLTQLNNQVWRTVLLF